MKREKFYTQSLNIAPAFAADKQRPRIDITGQKFGRLTAVRFSHIEKCGSQSQWVFLCDCGIECIKGSSSVKSGNTSSCGCLGVERYKKLTERQTTHGLSKSPEYKSWRHMKERCSSISRGQERRLYFERGITVCERWINSFENFYADMGPRPTKTHSIDRINVNGNYEPSNCRWATPIEQARNTRRNKLRLHGKVVTQQDLADRIGVDRKSIAYHQNIGKTAEQIIKFYEEKHKCQF